MSDRSQPDANRQFNLRLTFVLIIAVALWGIYLAVGATLFNQDARKGYIIFGCTVAFLTMWGYVIAFKRPPLAGPSGVSTSVNKFSLVSFLLASGSAIVMAIAASGAITEWLERYPLALLLSFIAALMSAVLAVVGLSDRAHPKLRSLGLAALMAAAATLVLGFFVPAF